MRQKTVLLIDKDGDCEELLALAAARSGLRVRWLQTSREAFKVIAQDDPEIAMIVVDVDPGAHGLALLEAVSACADRPPLMVVTGLEEAYMAPIARRHGALACVAKPLVLEKLGALIEELSASRHLAADNWGHLKPGSSNGKGSVARSRRGIAAKLSPTGSNVSGIERKEG